MSKYKRLIVFVFCSALVVSVYPQRRMNGAVSRNESSESDYLFAFTRATKLYVFGDLGNALSLYRECLKYEPGSAALNYQISLIYTRGGDIENARNFARVAYDKDRNNEWYARQYARLCQGAGLYDSALYVYKGLLKGNGDDADIYLMMSQIMERKGDFSSAILFLDSIENEIGITQEVTVNKARIFNETGDTKSALKVLRSALALNKGDYIVRGVMAEMFRDANKPDSAEFYYRSIILDHQDDPNVVFSFAEFLVSRKKVNEAKELYIKALKNPEIDPAIKLNYLYNAIQHDAMFAKLSPVLEDLMKTFYGDNKSDVRSKALYADYLYRTRRYAATIPVLKDIMSVSTENYAAWEQLLFSFNNLNQKDSVVFYSIAGIRRFPDEVMSYLLGGSALYELKEYNQAIEILKAGLPYSDNSRIAGNMRSLLAECYSKTKRLDLSDQMYESALQIDSSDIVVMNNYAYSLAERNIKLDLAERLSAESISKEPENGTYLDTFGWIKYRQGDYKAALKMIKKAIRIEGETNADILDHLGDIYLKMGKRNKAVKVWKQAIPLANGELLESLHGKVK